jgi:hypothetical protein
VFDPVGPAWRWDIDRIRARSYTENVADLMVEKMKRLSAPAQEAMKQLACLGNVANVATLTLVYEQTEDALHAGLWEAVHAGLVLRQESAYTFLHDRIQQAAYSLIPEERRADTHLRIGRMLLTTMMADQLDEHLFDVASQLNRGAARLIERDERAGNQRCFHARLCASGLYLRPSLSSLGEGYQFAKLACDLAEKHGFIANQPKVYHATGTVSFWTQPSGAAIDFMRATFRAAVETGDLSFACYGLYQIVTGLLLRNDPLDAVWRVGDGGDRSHGPPWGFRWIGERKVDWTDTADRDDCRLILAADDPVVMRSSSHAMHEAPDRRRHARSWVEISAAVDPPSARDDDAKSIGRIGVRRAHVSRAPADKDIVETRRSAVPGQGRNVGAARRKRGLRFPLQCVRRLDDRLSRIERTGGRTRQVQGQRRKERC